MLLAGLVACGDDGGIGETASARLTPHVMAVRAAADSGEPAAAYEALAELRRRVTELRQADELSEGEAATVLAASARVEAELADLTAPLPGPSSAEIEAQTTTTAGDETTTATEAERKPKDEEEEKDEEKEERRKPGEGKGKGGD